MPGVTDRKNHCTWPQMWGRLQPARDFSPAGETRMNAAAGGLKPRRRLKPAEACPTWTGGPTLARKCEVIPAPALSGRSCVTTARCSSGSCIFAPADRFVPESDTAALDSESDPQDSFGGDTPPEPLARAPDS